MQRYRSECSQLYSYSRGALSCRLYANTHIHTHIDKQTNNPTIDNYDKTWLRTPVMIFRLSASPLEKPGDFCSRPTTPMHQCEIPFLLFFFCFCCWMAMKTMRKKNILYFLSDKYQCPEIYGGMRSVCCRKLPANCCSWGLRALTTLNIFSSILFVFQRMCCCKGG